MPDRPLPTDSDGSFPNRVSDERSSMRPAPPQGDPPPPPSKERLRNLLKQQYKSFLLPPDPSSSQKPQTSTKQTVRLQLPPKPDTTGAVKLNLPPKPSVPEFLHSPPPKEDPSFDKFNDAAALALGEVLGIPEEDIPFISIVVAAPPDKQQILSVKQSLGLAYPPDRFEIIVARGRQPSVQRNNAVKESKGSLIYFLDDDSVPYMGNLILAVERFKDAEVQVVGGPNLVPPDSPRLERSFGEVMGSWLAFGPSQARYRQIGKTRESGEKELILCNMVFRKSAFEKHGGFDEALYPNEENALMDAIQNDGGKLIYDPDFLVHRRPRQSLGAFCKMLMNYGRGRAEQFRLHPTLGSAPNFVPPAFLLYLLAAPFLPMWALWPLSVYTLAVVMQVVALDPMVIFSIPRLAPLIFMSHLFYGAGFIKGLFTRLKPKDQPSNVEVVLERISPA